MYFRLLDATYGVFTAGGWHKSEADTMHSEKLSNDFQRLIDEHFVIKAQADASDKFYRVLAKMLKEGAI